MFTVKQLSQLSGVTSRTLHYYDQIGLLKPARVGDNGYRYYDETSLMQLQQILLYRTMDLPLEQIRNIIQQPDFEITQALRQHKQELRKRMTHCEQLIITVENTLDYMEGKKQMSPKQLFSALDEQQQAEYEKEAMQMYNPEIVKESNQKWKSYSQTKKQSILDEQNAIYLDIVNSISQGAASPEVQAGIKHWHQHMQYFWSPNNEQLVAIAEGYSLDPRFKVNFDKYHPDLANFMLEAVKIYVQQNENS